MLAAGFQKPLRNMHDIFSFQCSSLKMVQNRIGKKNPARAGDATTRVVSAPQHSTLTPVSLCDRATLIASCAPLLHMSQLHPSVHTLITIFSTLFLILFVLQIIDRICLTVLAHHAHCFQIAPQMGKGQAVSYRSGLHQMPGRRSLGDGGAGTND